MPIHFLSDVYRSVVVQKFCYHGNVTKRLLLTLAIWVRVRVILRNEIRSNLDKCWKLKLSLPLGPLFVSLLRSAEETITNYGISLSKKDIAPVFWSDISPICFIFVSHLEHIYIF